MRRCSLALTLAAVLAIAIAGPACGQTSAPPKILSNSGAVEMIPLPAVTSPELLPSYLENQPLYRPGSFNQAAKREAVGPASPMTLATQKIPEGERSDIELASYQPSDPRDPGITETEREQKTKTIAETKFPNFRITGFTQLDGGWYSQDPRNMATVGDAQDGVGFRRARLATVGNVAEFTSYMFEVDFATAGRPSFFDMWGEQGNIPFFGAVRIGQYLQPFSVDAMSGFRNLPFLERSLPFLAFVPFRRVGVMASNWSDDERTIWSYSVFRTGGFNNAPLGDDRFATDIGDKGGYSFSGRAVQLVQYDPEADDRYLWHIGASYDFSQLGQNDAPGSGTTAGGGPSPFYQSRVLPEFGPLGSPEVSQSFGQAFAATPIFVDSGKYAATNFNLWGLETVYQAGPFSAQAEWMGTSVNSAVGPIFYQGAYAEVMYRLTGETRPYDKKLGALKNVIPYTDFISLKPGGICGWGAWEVAARWSYVDINNPNSLNGHYYNSVTNTFTSQTGGAGNGRLNESTVGMSWFINANTKLQFNWIHAMLQNKAKGFSDADLFVTRFQVAF
jgi:phosphate-selective porin OprO and OprP